jgi:hypothetical protein
LAHREALADGEGAYLQLHGGSMMFSFFGNTSRPCRSKRCMSIAVASARMRLCQS